MNEDVLKGKWNEAKGEVKERRGNLTGDGLMVISGEKDKLVGALQKKLGIRKTRLKKNTSRLPIRKNNRLSGFGLNSALPSRQGVTTQNLGGKQNGNTETI